ncbi:hypothetical protein MMPV_001248 [Pyropia vietnamensis]
MDAYAPWPDHTPRGDRDGGTRRLPPSLPPDAPAAFSSSSASQQRLETPPSSPASPHYVGGGGPDRDGWTRSVRLPKGRVFVVPRGATGGDSDRSTAVAEAIAAAGGVNSGCSGRGRHGDDGWGDDGGACTAVAVIPAGRRLASVAPTGGGVHVHDSGGGDRRPIGGDRRPTGEVYSAGGGGYSGHGKRMTKVPSISSAAAVAMTTMARIASSRAGSGYAGGVGGLSGADVQTLSGPYERAILRMAGGGSGESGEGVAPRDTTLSLVTSPSEVEVVSTAVRLARTRAAPRRGRLLLGARGGWGGGRCLTSRRSRFLAVICPRRRRAAAEAAAVAAAAEAAAADAKATAAAKTGRREVEAAAEEAGGSEAPLPRGHHRLAAAARPSPPPCATPSAAADSKRKAAAAAEWVLGIEANPSDVLVVPSADVDVDLHGRYPVSTVSSTTTSSSSASPAGSPGATAATAVRPRHGGGSGKATIPPASAFALSASSSGRSSAGGGKAHADASVRSVHAPPRLSPPAPHPLAAMLKSASADDTHVEAPPSRRREASLGSPTSPSGGAAHPPTTNATGFPANAARPTTPTVPVVAAALAAAPVRLGLRPPENSVDSYNVHVSYEPDEFVAFLDRRSAPRAPRVPWVARWVPGRHPASPSQEAAESGESDGDVGRRRAAVHHGRHRWGGAAAAAQASHGGSGEAGLAPSGPSWANQWGSAAIVAATPASPAAPKPSSPLVGTPPAAAKPLAIRRVADVLRRHRPPVSTV